MSINKAMAAFNLAAQEKSNEKPAEATKLNETLLANNTKNTAPKTELKPAYLNGLHKTQQSQTQENKTTKTSESNKPQNPLNQMAQAFANAGRSPNANATESATQSPTKSEPITQTKPNSIIQKPAITRVDLSIAGTPHRISCPSDEVANLNKTADTLNKNLKELRTAVGKNPSNEELLVLHCLELYDQIRELQTWQDKAKEQSAKEQAFLDKLLKDASAIA